MRARWFKRKFAQRDEGYVAVVISTIMNRPCGISFDIFRCLAFLAACLVCSQAVASALKLEATIPLGAVAGRIDHLAVDAARKRLYVAELVNNRVAVIDLDARTVLRTLDNFLEPQGIGYEPTTDTLYVANGGDGSVRLYSAATFESIGRIELRDEADNVRVDAAHGRVWVGYGSGLASIDVDTHALRTFPLGGHPEAFRITPSQRVFVNVPRVHAVVVLAAGGRTRRLPIPIAGANYPLAIDDGGRLLLPLRHPAHLLVMDEHGRHATANLCDDADDAYVDARRKRLYVSCGDGHLDVFERSGTTYRRIDEVATAPNARTSLFVADRDRLYLAVPASDGTPAAVWIMKPI